MGQLTKSQMSTNQDQGLKDMINATVAQLLLAYVTVTPAAETCPSNDIIHHSNQMNLWWLPIRRGVWII